MTSPNRYAVLVGCTYKGHSDDSRPSSINNVALMSETLRSRLHFNQNNIKLLVENDGQHGGQQQPTRENITNAIAKCIRDAAPGDVICFYFSGRCDPATHFIVASDLQVISDQYFAHDVLPKLPECASFTMVVDASYCKDLIDKTLQPTTNEQVAAAGGIAILLSGCRPDEKANEYNAPDGKVYGAFTYALKQVLHEHPGPIRNRELIREAKIKVTKEGVPLQNPCLYCADTSFLFEK